MKSFSPNNGARYISLDESDDIKGEVVTPKPASRARPAWLVALVAAACGVGLLSGISLDRTVLYSSPTFSTLPSLTPITTCTAPTVRREWRSLARPEKAEYIRAVKCLKNQPSRLQDSSSLYDDFPRIHKLISQEAHKGPSFLPWHRYYLQIYENALRQECSFKGELPYWDWSLDWDNFSASPVWSSEDGFGGNGNSSDTSVGAGSCVTDGPFADFEVEFYDDKSAPHCLSRGFAHGAEAHALGELVQPNAINKLMHEPDFYGMASEVERRGHKFMSQSVRGDFSAFTGPNDPVFFLHHTNLDRIWAQWQKLSPIQRGRAYSGKAEGDSVKAASLEDWLEFDDLAPRVTVNDVMDTRTGMFCYHY